jgi:hypothetical protein
MRKLNPLQLEQLRASNRRLRLGFLVSIAIVVLGIALMIILDSELLGIGGATVASFVIVIALGANQGVMKALQLGPHEARAALAEDRRRRRGKPGLSSTVRANLLLAGGLVSLVVLVIAAAYIFQHAGTTVEEDAPMDPWLPTSFIAGFVSLIVAPTLLLQSQAARRPVRR